MMSFIRSKPAGPAVAPAVGPAAPPAAPPMGAGGLPTHGLIIVLTVAGPD